jgi:hypothetical protein
MLTLPSEGKETPHSFLVQAEARWAALEGAPPKSFRKRIANFGNYLLSKIHPAEQFLKSIPLEFTTLHVVHPANVHPTLVRRRIRLVAKRYRKSCLHELSEQDAEHH